MLIVGYFGRGNCGDDLMREAVERHLTDRDDWRAEFRSLPPLGFSGLKEAVGLLRVARRVSVVALCGGSHFHDSYGRGRSTKLLAMFLTLFGLIRLMGAQVALLGVGIGPIRRASSRTLMRGILRLSGVILVRDIESWNLVRTLDRNANPLLGADLAFLLPIKRVDWKEQRHVGVSVMPYFALYQGEPRLDEAMLREIADSLEAWHRRDPLLRVTILAFHAGTGDADAAAVLRLKKLLDDRRVPCVDRPVSGAREVEDAYGGLRALIAFRFHAALMGYLAGLPTLAVEYQAKSRVLVSDLFTRPVPRVMPEHMIDGDRWRVAIDELEHSPATFICDSDQEPYYSKTRSVLDDALERLR